MFSDMSKAYKNAHYFDPEKGDVQSVAGNYIIIQYSENVYAALCHLQTDSVKVSPGQYVKKAMWPAEQDMPVIPVRHIYIFGSWTAVIYLPPMTALRF